MIGGRAQRASTAAEAPHESVPQGLVVERVAVRSHVKAPGTDSDPDRDPTRRLEEAMPSGVDDPEVTTIGRVVGPRVSVVIPALNEAKNLTHVLPEIPDSVWEVILVDGGSHDGTVDVFRALRPDGLVLTHERRGKGNALAAGFAACRGDIVVMLDADGSANPAEIPKFVEALLSGVDFAKGTRFAHGGGSDDITSFRRWGNTMLVTLVNLLFRVRYTDLCYGMNAFWRRCLPCVTPDRDGFEAETLMNLRLAKSSFRVQEVGSHERRRLHGASHLHTIRDGFQVLRTILRERLSSASTASEATIATLEDAPSGPTSQP